VVRSECELPCEMRRFASFAPREGRPFQTRTSLLSQTPALRHPHEVQMNKLRSNPVKALMDRIKIAFAAIFPAVWLLLCGQALSAQRMDWSKETSRDHPGTLQGCKPCSPDALISQDATARRAPSRLGKSGNANTLFVNPISRSHAVERMPIPLSAQRESPFGLATCWQFVCRTALDPRAPSSLS
jgi:hypothetical protein